MDSIIAEFAVSMQQSADEAMQRLHCNDECEVCVWVLWVLWVREGVRVDWWVRVCVCVSVKCVCPCVCV